MQNWFTLNLFCFVLFIWWHINFCRLFNAKAHVIQERYQVMNKSYTPAEWKTITLIYKNLHFLVNCERWRNGCVRKRINQELLGFTSGCDTIYSELHFFALSPRGWHKANLRYSFIFVSLLSLHDAVQVRLKIFNHLYFFFVLGSCTVSTLASLVHLDFCLPVSQGPSCPYCLLWTARCCIFQLLYIFRTPHTLWLLFLPAPHPRSSCGISAVFCLP